MLDRSSSANNTNPFGSTFCFGLQRMIFEVRLLWSGPAGRCCWNRTWTQTTQGSVCPSSGDAEQPHRFGEPLWCPPDPRPGLTSSRCWSQSETLQNQVPYWAGPAAASLLTERPQQSRYITQTDLTRSVQNHQFWVLTRQQWGRGHDPMTPASASLWDTLNPDPVWRCSRTQQNVCVCVSVCVLLAD